MFNLSDKVEVANHQEPHCPVVLLLDVSRSMEGPKIQQLNDGLRFFKDDVCGVDGEGGDALARKRIDLSVITFSSSANKLQDFGPVDQFHPVPLIADGATAMGDAVMQAIELLEARKHEYRTAGTDYYRPWIFLITDGEPTDMRPGDSRWNEVVGAIRAGETAKKFAFFTVGVDGADLSVLNQLAPQERPAVRLRQGMFRGLFLWLSSSLRKVSGSRVGETTQLEDPRIGANAWAV